MSRVSRGEPIADARPARRRGRHFAARSLRVARVDWDGRDEDARETDLTPLEQARRTAALCQEKLATDVTILDMRGVCDFTDFFVIATGRNARQTKAIYDEVSGVLKKEHGLLPRSSAGATEAAWIVADYLDVVLHLFTPETRGFDRLEELWSDVPSVEVEGSRPLAAPLADDSDVSPLVGWRFERDGAGEARRQRSTRLANADASGCVESVRRASENAGRARERTWSACACPAGASVCSSVQCATGSCGARGRLTSLSGAIAQLGERRAGSVEVAGSSPAGSITRATIVGDELSTIDRSLVVVVTERGDDRFAPRERRSHGRPDGPLRDSGR